MGYRLYYEYLDLETGHSYMDDGAYFKNKAEAYSHLGEPVHIIIYRNLCATKDEMNKGIWLYGTIWLSLGISLTTLTVISVVLVIVFRKKVFLTTEDLQTRYRLPE